MADLSELSDVDLSDVKPVESRECFPPGEYEIVCIESDAAPTKNGNLLALNLTWQVVSGPHENRKLWDRINVKCYVSEDGPQKAAEIGKRTLRSMCDVFGFTTIPGESSEFHDKPIKAKITIRKGNNGYKDSNEIDWAATMKLNGIGAAAESAKAAPATATPVTATRAAAQSVAAGASSGPAWKRKAS